MKNISLPLGNATKNRVTPGTIVRSLKFGQGIIIANKESIIVKFRDIIKTFTNQGKLNELDILPDIYLRRYPFESVCFNFLQLGSHVYTHAYGEGIVTNWQQSQLQITYKEDKTIAVIYKKEHPNLYKYLLQDKVPLDNFFDLYVDFSKPVTEDNICIGDIVVHCDDGVGIVEKKYPEQVWPIKIVYSSCYSLLIDGSEIYEDGFLPKLFKCFIGE